MLKKYSQLYFPRGILKPASNSACLVSCVNIPKSVCTNRTGVSKLWSKPPYQCTQNNDLNDGTCFIFSPVALCYSHYGHLWALCNHPKASFRLLEFCFTTGPGAGSGVAMLLPWEGKQGEGKAQNWDEGYPGASGNLLLPSGATSSPGQGCTPQHPPAAAGSRLACAQI